MHREGRGGRFACLDVEDDFAVRDLDLTSIVALHDLNLAVRGADRLVVLHKGKIHTDGPPHAVLTDSMVAQVYGVGLPVNSAPSDAPFLLVQA